MSKFAVVDGEGRLLAFYSDDVHGPRELQVTVPPAEEGGEPTVELHPNPDCRIPAAATEISDELWADWLGRQETAALVKGQLVDMPRKPRVWTWAQIRDRRDGLIRGSDWTQLPSARTRLGQKQAAEWDAYRDALFDLPQKYSDPAKVIWPAMPA